MDEDKKRYWFESTIGVGWAPRTREGIFVFVVHVLILVFVLFQLSMYSRGNDLLIPFSYLFPLLIVTTVSYFLFGYFKGTKLVDPFYLNAFKKDIKDYREDKPITVNPSEFSSSEAAANFEKRANNQRPWFRYIILPGLEFSRIVIPNTRNGWISVGVFFAFNAIMVLTHWKSMVTTGEGLDTVCLSLILSLCVLIFVIIFKGEGEGFMRKRRDRYGNKYK